MSIFNGRFLSDQDIWDIIRGIEVSRDTVQETLALCHHAAGRGGAAQGDEAAGGQDAAELARELHRLNKICLPAAGLRECLGDLAELQEVEAEAHEGAAAFLEEYKEICRRRAGEIYSLLLDRGYLENETEDPWDIKILEFIDYAGPEYAWRLGINIGLELEECRRRLENLLSKGFLERVEGNMLGNYHREKSWTKHMNHTYYRTSREGRLYLRQRRQGEIG